MASYPWILPTKTLVNSSRKTINDYQMRGNLVSLRVVLQLLVTLSPPRLSAYAYSLRFGHNSAGHNSRLVSEQPQAALVPIIHLCYFSTFCIHLLALTWKLIIRGKNFAPLLTGGCGYANIARSFRCMTMVSFDSEPLPPSHHKAIIKLQKHKTYENPSPQISPSPQITPWNRYNPQRRSILSFIGTGYAWIVPWLKHRWRLFYFLLHINIFSSSSTCVFLFVFILVAEKYLSFPLVFQRSRTRVVVFCMLILSTFFACAKLWDTERLIESIQLV